MFQDYISRISANSNAFARVAVEKTTGVSGDGWTYRWTCRANAESGLSIWVGLDGTADYSEAPDCAEK